METLSQLTAILLFIPYVAWGIHTLQLRYKLHEEASPTSEALTLLGVMLILVIEIRLLQQSLQSSTLLFMFSVMGLVVAGAALYGHILVSLTSRLIVDIVVPGGDSQQSTPRLGPAESLERQHDYEGALQEYLVLARIFPRDPQIHLRIASNLLHLERHEEAPAWFERALRYINSGDRALNVTQRLCEVYENALKNPGAAIAALEAHLKRFPEEEYAGAIRERIAALQNPEAPAAPPLDLDALGENPLQDTEPGPESSTEPADDSPIFSLESMDTEPLLAPPLAPDLESPTGASPSGIGLAALGIEEINGPLEAKATEPSGPATSGGIGIEPMDHSPSGQTKGRRGRKP